MIARKTYLFDHAPFTPSDVLDVYYSKHFHPSGLQTPYVEASVHIDFANGGSTFSDLSGRLDVEQVDEMITSKLKYAIVKWPSALLDAFVLTPYEKGRLKKTWVKLDNFPPKQLAGFSIDVKRMLTQESSRYAQRKFHDDQLSDLFGKATDMLCSQLSPAEYSAAFPFLVDARSMHRADTYLSIRSEPGVTGIYRMALSTRLGELVFREAEAHIFKVLDVRESRPVPP